MKHVHIIDETKCTKCGTCLEVCPSKISAIVKVSGEEARNLKILEKPIPIASARASTMKLKKIATILNAEFITRQPTHVEIRTGCGCDLMSDVLVFTKPGSMLLSGLTSLQVIYTASTAGVQAVCFVRGKKPPQETVDLAGQEKDRSSDNKASHVRKLRKAL